MNRWRLACATALLFLFLCVGEAFPKKHVLFWRGSFESALGIAKTLHKPMLLDFYMPNDFDRQLDSITYRDPDVVYFIGISCLPYHIDADASDSASRALVKHYNVENCPTVIITRSDGEEIDRIVGYFPPKQFLYMVENFINDTMTVGSLRRRLKADTNDLETAFQLAKRLEMRVELDSAMKMFDYVISRGRESSILVQNAMFQRGAFRLRVLGNPHFLIEFLERSHVDSLRQSAYEELFTFYDRWKRGDSLLAIYGRAVRDYPRDAAILNNYAWALTEHGGDLDTALTLARRAIAIDSTATDYYDTMAEVYAKKKQYDEAVRAIEKALRLKKNDPYLKGREKQFKAALAQSGGKSK